MPISSFYGLQTSLRGLLAQQRRSTSPATTSPTRTPRATRARRPTLAASPALEIAGRRHRRRLRRAPRLGRRRPVLPPRPRQFLDLQYRGQNVAPRASGPAARDALDQAEGALAEPGDNGINAQLGKFWDAWRDLANADPARPGRARRPGRAGAPLADAFRPVYAQIAQRPDAGARRVRRPSPRGPRHRRQVAQIAKRDRAASTRRSSAQHGAATPRTTCSTAATSCSTSSPARPDLGRPTRRRHDQRRLRRHASPGTTYAVVNGAHARGPARRPATLVARRQARRAARRRRPAAARSTRYLTALDGVATRRSPRGQQRRRGTSLLHRRRRPPPATLRRLARAARRADLARRRHRRRRAPTTSPARSSQLRGGAPSTAPTARSSPASAPTSSEADAPGRPTPRRSPTRSTTAARASPASRSTRR